MEDKEAKAAARAQKRTEKQLLDALAELGGTRFDDDDIVQEGDRLVLPKTMSMESAIKFLNGRLRADNEVITIHRSFKYRPWDGAIAMYRVFKRTFGAVGHGGTTSFWGDTPPQFISVNTGPDQSEQVPWGSFTIPLLENVTFELGTSESDLGPLFSVSVQAPRKWKAHVEGVLVLVDEELKASSLYRGKAFDGRPMPEFLDLSGVDATKVVYSEDTATQLEANIWSVMRHTDALRTADIPRKRSALLYGPYGTGKTLTGYRTAQVAVENGWTCILARPGRDDLEDVMRTAQLYQPACVFAEDLDTVADSSSVSADMAARLLDIFDGITAKGTELLVVLTTNHPERIHKGMLRPGRLDAVIEVAGLDAAGIEQLIRVSVPSESLAPDVAWAQVTESMADMLPSYVKEGADRAFRYALARADGDLDEVSLTTQDFVNAAIGLRPQLDLMEGAKERAGQDRVGGAIRRSVEETLAASIRSDLLDESFLDKMSDGQVSA